MDLDQLRYLVAAVDRGSFAQAAAALGVTPPAVSMSVVRLEEELGVKLFERTTQGSKPTPVARNVVAGARRVLQASEELRSVASGESDDDPGTLDIAMSASKIPVVCRLIADVHEEMPNLRTRLHITKGRRTPLDALRRGQTDIALCRLGDVPSDLMAVLIGRDELLGVFPAGFGLDEVPIPLAELAALPLIAPIDGAERYDWNRTFENHGISPHPVVEVEPEGIIECVHAGLGVAVRSRFAFYGSFNGADLTLRPIVLPHEEEIWSVRLPGPQPASVLAFERCVQARFGKAKSQNKSSKRALHA
jgi:DNA-binding transcriptional LysR family regulator